MKLKFDISVAEFNIVTDILSHLLPKNYQVWVFGSRAKGRIKFNSDLDLALEYKTHIPSTIISQLKEAFSESDLPYTVDVLDINAVEPYFQKIINQKKVCFPFEVKSKVPRLRFAGFGGEWEEKRLDNIGSFKGGGTPSKLVDEYWVGDIPWISSSDISEQDIHNIKISRFINETSIKESATKIIPKESVLFVSRVGIGKLAINKKEICTSQDFTSLVPMHNSSYFLGYSFLAKNNILIKYSQGTSIKGFTKNDIETLKLNLPTKPEQQKIVAFLTAVDNKIEQLSKKQGLLGEYKKGVMQKIFSQTIRFKADDDSDFSDWKEKKLGGVGLIVTGKTPSTSNPELWNGDISFITPTDITEKGKYQAKTQRMITKQRNTKLLPIGSIAYTCIASIGKMIITTNNSSTNQQINSIIVDGAFNNEYVYYALLKLTPYIKSTQANTTLPIINKTEFSEFKIQIPSLEEQTKIANFLSSIDNKTEQIGKQLDNSKQFKKALLQQMFV